MGKLRPLHIMASLRPDLASVFRTGDLTSLQIAPPSLALLGSTLLSIRAIGQTINRDFDLRWQSFYIIRKTTCYTTVIGRNADLIAEAAKLYLKPGDLIADVTFGRGGFWKKIDTFNYWFYPSDMLPSDPGVDKRDFRELCYPDEFFDVVIFDPPYQHHGAGEKSKTYVSKTYRNRETTFGLNHSGIIDLYRAGMQEAKRVLKNGGLLWIKSQDEVESGKQKRSTFEVFQIATADLGLSDQDCFVLYNGKPHIQHARQHHARKNCSFLWIFRKI